MFLIRNLLPRLESGSTVYNRTPVWKDIVPSAAVMMSRFPLPKLIIILVFVESWYCASALTLSASFGAENRARSSVAATAVNSTTAQTYTHLASLPPTSSTLSKSQQPPQTNNIKITCLLKRQKECQNRQDYRGVQWCQHQIENEIRNLGDESLVEQAVLDAIPVVSQKDAESTILLGTSLTSESGSSPRKWKLPKFMERCCCWKSQQEDIAVASVLSQSSFSWPDGGARGLSPTICGRSTGVSLAQFADNDSLSSGDSDSVL